MRARGISRWDELAVIYPDEPALIDPTTTQDQAMAVRCRRRIAPFEEAFELAEKAGHLEPHAWKFALLGNELERRWARWCGISVRRGPEDGTASGRRDRWISVTLVGAALLIVLMSMAAFMSGRLFTSYSGQIGLVCFVALFVGILIFARRRFVALSRTTPQRACPTCGYDLKGLPPAIETGMLKGLDAGPRVCPECGTLWPLVPPGDVPSAGVPWEHEVSA